MFELKDFDSYRENNCIEIKKATGGLPSSVWETYSAFANCDGGIIILGVKENIDGSWICSGLKDSGKLKKSFFDTINNPNKVNINLLSDKDVKTEEIDGNTIIVINVPKAKREQKPVYINNDIFKGTYRRNWEGDYLCSQAEVKSMLRDQTEETMDMKVLENTDMSVLNRETVRAYRNRHSAYKTAHVWEELNDDEYLERIGAAKISSDGKLHPTAAGLLMFGDEYKILYEFPEYFLDYRELLDPSIRWTDRLQSSSGDWTGNLFDFFFRVYNKIVKDLKIPFKLEGETRIDDTPVHNAIREAFANCIVNYDFFEPRGIVIKKNADSIVFENPGSIRTGKNQMLKGGISDPRNKALMKMFNMIGIGERAGSGVPDIYSVWEKQNWKKPIVEEQYGPDRTTLTLFFQKSDDKKATIKSDDKKATINSKERKLSKTTEDNLSKILNFMQQGREYASTEIADMLGLEQTRTKELLKLLINNGDIITLGKNKGQKYKLS